MFIKRNTGCTNYSTTFSDGRALDLLSNDEKQRILEKLIKMVKPEDIDFIINILLDNLPIIEENYKSYVCEQCDDYVEIKTFPL